jgi:hypothetical protein
MSFYRAIDSSVLRASSRVEKFVSNAWTSGPWSKDLQHGGPPTALLARCIEHVAMDHGFSHIARISASFLRAVPVSNEPLFVTSTMDRVGGKTAQASAEIQNSKGERLMTASATLIRSLSEAIPAPFAAPSSMLPPKLCHPTNFGMLWDLSAENYGAAFELMSTVPSPTLGFGPNKCWFRQKVALVEQEPLSPLCRTLCAADSCNGLSSAVDYSEWTYMNVDITVACARAMQGEWVGIDARTEVGAGHGVALGGLFDEKGQYGQVLQAIVFNKRGEKRAKL